MLDSFHNLPEAHVLLANAINGIGVLGLIMGHFLIARSKMLHGFLCSSLGGVFVAIGSAILGSWPVVTLNVIWFLIGVIGFIRTKKQSGSGPVATHSRHSDLVFVVLYTVLFFVAYSLFSLMGNHGLGAWTATAFYLTSFVLLSTGKIQSRHYLFIGVLGYLLLLMHLILSQNYAVLVNETIGAVIGLYGIGHYYWQKRSNQKTVLAEN